MTTDRDGVENSWVRTGRSDAMTETLAGWTDEYPVRTGDPFPQPTRPVVEATGSCRAPRSDWSCSVLMPGCCRFGDPVTRRAVAAMACAVAIVPHHVTADGARPAADEIQPGAGVVVADIVIRQWSRELGQWSAGNISGGWLRGDMHRRGDRGRVLVPQVMAYAELAGTAAGRRAVGDQLGPLAVYAVLGTSR